MMATSRAFAASAASGAASRINGRVPRCRILPLASRPPDWAWEILDHGFGGTAWAVWSMMRCNAGEWRGHRCGLVACGIPAALGGAGRGDCWLRRGEYGGALGQRRGLVRHRCGRAGGTCVPASSVKSAAASGNSCVACSAPAGGHQRAYRAKGSVAVAAPAGENTTVSPSPLSPLLPENTAMVGASAASSAARQMVRGLLRSTPPAAPKGGIASAASATIAAGCQPRLPRRTVPPARPAKRWDSTHPRRWHSAIDPACNDPCDPGPVQNGRQPMCRPVVRKDSRCPRPRAQVPPSSVWCRTQARRLRQKRARTPPTTNGGVVGFGT